MSNDHGFDNTGTPIYDTPIDGEYSFEELILALILMEPQNLTIPPDFVQQEYDLSDLFVQKNVEPNEELLSDLGVGMPLSSIQDDATFVAWTVQLEELMRNDTNLTLTTEQANELIRLANLLGVDYIIDDGHPNTTWDTRHIHFSPDGRRTHIRVEEE